MPNEIYFLRHGESLTNQEGILCGRTDIELSSKGLLQAQEFARSCQIQFDHILSSPLRRALATAKEVAKLQSNVNVSTIDDLVEQDYGEWEGINFTSIQSVFLDALNPPMGESNQSFHQRLERLKAHLETYTGRILIVSHGGVGSHFMSLYGIPKRLIHNAELVKIYATLS